MIKLVPVTQAHQVEWLRQKRSDPALYKYFRQDAPITEEQQASWWKNLDQNRVRLFIIHNENDSWVGYIGFNPFLRYSSKAEFGVFIIPEFQHYGYFKEAMNELLHKGFEEYGLSTIYSEILDYPDENRFDIYKPFGFMTFSEDQYYHSYVKQGRRIGAIKFFMTKDMWETRKNDPNADGKLGPTAQKAITQVPKQKRHKRKRRSDYGKSHSKRLHPGTDRIAAPAE